MRYRASIARLKWLVLVFVLGLPTFGNAQQSDNRIFTLGQDRLFNQSDFGVRVRKDIADRSSAVAAENRRIEGELKIEEQALTDQRASLSPAEFRVLADAFDKKVEKIRTEQAQKSLALNNFAEAEQQRFFKLAFPVLVKLANELSAVAILDERSTIIASEQMDITALAVTRVNEAIGDGSDAGQPESP
jgi:Skp family chaperone for outer membrane proteins